MIATTIMNQGEGIKLGCGVTIGAISLAGGQGKTTITMFLGLRLVSLGYRVCFIDCDPQANLSLYLNHGGWNGKRTILELLKNEIDVEKATHACLDGNASIIPADESLASATTFLAESGNAANILKRKLRGIQKQFDFLLIDTPPSQTQIGLCGIGACQVVVIPVEVTAKGTKGLLHTIKSLAIYESVGSFSGTIVGITPFRERWFGQQMANESKISKDIILSFAEQAEIPVLPSFIESELFKKGLVSSKLPGSFDKNKEKELNYPIDAMTHKILHSLNITTNHELVR